jgi:hypothetical protein
VLFRSILKKAKLGEVKIDGEKARGKIESEGKAQPIFFAREGGVWKVDILPAIFEPPPVEEKKGKSEK